MTNANPLINLRNKAIIWGIIAVISFAAAWWFYGFFGSTSSPVVQKVELLKARINIIKEDGVVLNGIDNQVTIKKEKKEIVDGKEIIKVTTEKKDWKDLVNKEKNDERWSTMVRLVPSLQKLVGLGTPAGVKNIATMKDISEKSGNGSYISGLEKSWTGDAETSLNKAQADIAEVIPVFTGISELATTRNIAGKITLKSLNDYIQTNIVEKYGLTNAFGQIGIDRVKFLTDAPEVGVYEVPLRFERVPNDNIINLIKFLGKTGGVRISESAKAVNIEHVFPQPIKTDDGQSTLKNLLITVKDMTITPVKNESQETIAANITTKKPSMWDVNITLQFYIRGVSRDYIASLDTNIGVLLSKSGKDSLIFQGNTLLNQCNGCGEAPQIRDIINLLGQAKTAYDSIVLEERDPKKNFTPLDILEHRVGLMTTIETLKIKLDNLTSIISPRT